MTSLAQILLDPDCRTITGYRKGRSFLFVTVIDLLSFEALIEREWLQAGHPFRSRCARSAFGKSSHGQESPLFTLFLDCTFQVKQRSLSLSSNATEFS